ncbi:MAG TPA: hypothetical protein VFE47_27505 [Tepidisphaeraceae bacterium]|jgi:chromosome segregation ATPase|nr:hypothetical protein [Tepidisphaeraceae bacterium]
MSAQVTPTFFERIGNLFRKPTDSTTQVRALLGGGDSIDNESTRSHIEEIEPRTTFLRPWAKREQAFDQLQNGVAALSDLMGTIRETLEKNSSRQDEMLNYLSHLPQALESLPESNRVQGEALKAIQLGIEQQNTQQNKLADVLERLSRDETAHGRVLGAVREKVDMIGMHEESISHSLTSVGKVLQAVSTTSETGTRVLESLRENLGTRDGQLETVIRQQNTRFTTMLSVAIVMSMAALTAVVVFGYLGYQTLSHMGK